MNIEDILDDMDELLDRGRAVPFIQHKVIIDADRMRELINDIRLNIPAEIKRAKLIDFDCDRIINDAKAKGEQIIQDAEERAKVMCSNDKIRKEAHEEGVQILARAQVASKEIRANSAAYVDRILTQAEESLRTSLEEVQRVKSRIEDSKKNSSRVQVHPDNDDTQIIRTKQDDARLRNSRPLPRIPH